jgi:ADP-ribose pyrophosphatase YjhB (NUDIX family)
MQTLVWAKRLQAMAQTGLTYATDRFDIERYTKLREIACEMMAAGAVNATPAQIAEIFTRDTGYATPKVDVRAAVFRDDKILLVKETSDGGWTLPGGWADVGDTPSEAAVREAREESGYEVVATKVAAVLDRDRQGHPPSPFATYKIFFMCKLVGGAPQTSNETDAVDFFPQNNLPPLSAIRITPAEIKMLFAHHRDPNLPTAFD